VITPGGLTITIPPGSTIFPDGTIKMPEGGGTVEMSILGINVKIQVTDSLKFESDGAITFIGRVEIATGNGTKVVLTGGGTREETYNQFNAAAAYGAQLYRARTEPLYLYIFVDENGGVITYPNGRTKTLHKGSIMRVDNGGIITIVKESTPVPGDPDPDPNSGGGCNAMSLTGLLGLLAAGLRKKK
jgi:hypothetical protein